jgi:eukaryotic-like serine/threonine-protein kinase
MPEAGKTPDTVRFGPFELSIETGELRKNGVRLPVAGQPIEVLTLLVKTPARLVTREELKRRLWGEDTFVDFEKGLNAAVNRLRDYLGDSATEPKYVETVPGRGYRFIAVLDLPPSVHEQSDNVVPIRPSEPERPHPKPEPPKPLWWKRKATIAIGACVVSTGLLYPWIRPRIQTLSSRLISSIAGLPRERLPADLSKGTIVLADFVNTTGDPVFDDTLKQGLSIQLKQSPFLDVESDRKVNETLKLMGHTEGDRLTPEVAVEICQRAGSKAVLTGSIAGVGRQYVIGLKASSCNMGDVLGEVQGQASNKEEVLKTLSAAAVSLRTRLGESLSSVEKYSTPLIEATTPSLEALKAFSLGRKAQLAQGDVLALPFYSRAVELDPNFALGYAAMASTYGNLNEAERSKENARKAYKLRDKVSEWERFIIDNDYYEDVTGDLEKATQNLEVWKQTYPRDYLPYGDLGVLYTGLGNLEGALEEAREAHRRQPDAENTYLNLGRDYASLNRLDEAEAVYKQAGERKLGSEFLLQYRYQLAFLKGDAAKMAQLVSAAMGKPGLEDALLASQADTEGWYGKLKDAQELTLRAMNSAEHNDARESAATYQAAAALREVESGNRDRALADANASLRLAPNRDVLWMAALARARAGDTAGAEKLAVRLDKTFPLDTQVQRYSLPTIRAAVALERKDPNRAVDLLKEASTIELGWTTAVTVFLCPAYLRGEAYLMLHDGKSAEEEFQKFIDHRGLVVNFPWGAVSRLGLARAYAMQGDTDKAKAAYQDFLTLWKDADPDIPVLKQAKAEYAKLSSKVALTGK